MKMIYQTVVDKNHGDCLQTAIASLLELSLDEVPDFIHISDWQSALMKFVWDRDYEFDGTLYNPNVFKFDSKWYDGKLVKQKCRFNELKKMAGVKGYFQASVLSPKYFNKYRPCNAIEQVTHSVIVDSSLNIVNPINEAYVGLKKFPRSSVIGYNGILSIMMINKREV